MVTHNSATYTLLLLAYLYLDLSIKGLEIESASPADFIIEIGPILYNRVHVLTPRLSDDSVIVTGRSTWSGALYQRIRNLIHTFMQCRRLNRFLS